MHWSVPRDMQGLQRQEATLFACTPHAVCSPAPRERMRRLPPAARFPGAPSAMWAPSQLRRALPAASRARPV